MIGVGALSTLVYIALAAAVCIPVLLCIMFIFDIKRGKLW